MPDGAVVVGDGSNGIVYMYSSFSTRVVKRFYVLQPSSQWPPKHVPTWLHCVERCIQIVTQNPELLSRIVHVYSMHRCANIHLSAKSFTINHAKTIIDVYLERHVYELEMERLVPISNYMFSQNIVFAIETIIQLINKGLMPIDPHRLNWMCRSSDPATPVLIDVDDNLCILENKIWTTPFATCSKLDSDDAMHTFIGHASAKTMEQKQTAALICCCTRFFLNTVRWLNRSKSNDWIEFVLTQLCCLKAKFVNATPISWVLYVMKTKMYCPYVSNDVGCIHMNGTTGPMQGRIGQLTVPYDQLEHSTHYQVSYPDGVNLEFQTKDLENTYICPLDRPYVTKTWQRFATYADAAAFVMQVATHVQQCLQTDTH